MICPYSQYSDYRLGRKISEQEYQKIQLQDLLKKDISLSEKHEISCELQHVKNDLDRLYSELDARNVSRSGFMFNQSTYENPVGV